MSILRAALRQQSTLPLLRCLPAVGTMTEVRSTSTVEADVARSREWHAKNENLKRPMSPFVIYKPQLTSVLSISHRMTGLSLSVLVYGWGLSQLAAGSTNFASQLATLSATLPPSMIFALKFLTVTSLAYHTLNGIRHLAWDMGYGFRLRELYLSGYVVLGLTALVAAGTLMYY